MLIQNELRDTDPRTCLLTDRSVQTKQIQQPNKWQSRHIADWERGSERNTRAVNDRMSEKSKEGMWQSWWQSHGWGGNMSEWQKQAEKMTEEWKCRGQKERKVWYFQKTEKLWGPCYHTHNPPPAPKIPLLTYYHQWPKQGSVWEEPCAAASSKVLTDNYRLWLPW